jgi:hypothetical protein
LSLPSSWVLLIRKRTIVILGECARGQVFCADAGTTRSLATALPFPVSRWSDEGLLDFTEAFRGR